MTEPIAPVESNSSIRHWTYVLNNYERALNSSEAAIEAGFRPNIQPPSFVAPAGISPLPDEVRHRANELVSRTEVLIERAQNMAFTERIHSPERTRAPHAVSSSTSHATAIDVRA